MPSFVALAILIVATKLALSDDCGCCKFRIVLVCDNPLNSIRLIKAKNKSFILKGCTCLCYFIIVGFRFNNPVKMFTIKTDCTSKRSNIRMVNVIARLCKLWGWPNAFQPL